MNTITRLLTALLIALFTTLRDRFPTGSSTGSFHTQSNDWFPAPSPTGAGTGRTGSPRGSSTPGTTHHHPLTTNRKDNPMTSPMNLTVDTNPDGTLRLAIATEAGDQGAFINIPADVLRGLIDDEARDVPGVDPARDDQVESSFAPAVGSRWMDRDHDVWTMRADGLMEAFETQPFPPAYVERKWGPLVPARELGADSDDTRLCQVPPVDPRVVRFDTQDQLEEYVETHLNEKGIDPSVALMDSNGDVLTAHRTAPGGDGYAFEYDLGRTPDNGQRHCCNCDEHLQRDCPELDWSWTPKFPVWVLETAKAGA